MKKEYFVRIGRIHQQGTAVAAVSVESGWLPISAVAPDVVSVEDALQHAVALAAMCADLDLRRPHLRKYFVPDEAVRLVCPLPSPRKVFAVGMNYQGHIAEIGETAPHEPFVFLKSSNALSDPFGDITIARRHARQLDYEVELAIVIGHPGRDFTAENAVAAIGGLAVANDLSAREWQNGSPWTQWLRAKGLDGFCPIGPWITTLDELPSLDSVAIRCYVNGEVRQTDQLASLVFDLPTMVSWVSQGVTLNPGDIILTGTPSGVSYINSEIPWLGNGDVVRCEIEGLGAIENQIVLDD